MASLRAGKHTFTEWPLGRTTAEAIEMAEAARQRSVKTAVGLQARANPAIVHLRNLVADGYVGRVMTCHVRLMREGVLSQDSGRTWQREDELGANTLTIACGHTIDALCSVVGEFADVAAVVSTQATTWRETDTGRDLPATLGWDCVSTDSLARHPDRPWRPVPEKVTEEVAERYISLSIDDLMGDVLRHYRVNVRPKVEATTASHSAAGSRTGVALEGSALRPEFATGLNFGKAAAVWLAADEDVFRGRIHAASLYSSKSARERMMIDRLLERALTYNARMVAAVNRHRFILVDVLQSDVKELAERRLSALGIDRR